jgi:hypothetical protein
MNKKFLSLLLTLVLLFVMTFAYKVVSANKIEDNKEKSYNLDLSLNENVTFESEEQIKATENLLNIDRNLLKKNNQLKIKLKLKKKANDKRYQGKINDYIMIGNQKYELNVDGQFEDVIINGVVIKEGLLEGKINLGNKIKDITLLIYYESEKEAYVNIRIGDTSDLNGGARIVYGDMSPNMIKYVKDQMSKYNMIQQQNTIESNVLDNELASADKGKKDLVTIMASGDGTEYYKRGVATTYASGYLLARLEGSSQQLFKLNWDHGLITRIWGYTTNASNYYQAIKGRIYDFCSAYVINANLATECWVYSGSAVFEPYQDSDKNITIYVPYYFDTIGFGYLSVSFITERTTVLPYKSGTTSYHNSVNHQLYKSSGFPESQITYTGSDTNLKTSGLAGQLVVRPQSSSEVGKSIYHYYEGQLTYKINYGYVDGGTYSDTITTEYKSISSTQTLTQ